MDIIAAAKSIDRPEGSPPAEQAVWGSRRRLKIVAITAVTVLVIVLGYGALQLRGAPAGRPTEAGQAHPGGGAAPGDSQRLGSVDPTASAGASASPAARGTPGAQRPPSTSGFPDPSNTGVPNGTRLSAYTGSCTIRTANTVIDAKTIDCTLNIRAKNVVIKRSKISGRVDSSPSGSVTIQDSEVDRGEVQEAAVGNSNITIYRSNIHGGQTSVNCDQNCLIVDSWLHAQYMPPGADWHLDAFLSNGGNHITLRHNTLACDHPASPSGCSGDAAIFGDFAPNSYFTFDNNLFVASMNLSYCAYGGSQDNKPYGGQADHIVFVNNVFQRGKNGKCGEHGPVAHFDESRPGNRWSNNVWDDGTPLKL